MRDLTDLESLRRASGRDIRALCRDGTWADRTFGIALGYYQANVAIVPAEYAFDFLLFCQRNPKPMPILDVTDPGDPEPRHVAPGADIRTDMPTYSVYRRGELVEERSDILNLWRKDHVAFILGCSFTFDAVLEQANVALPHLESGTEGRICAYASSIRCDPAGHFHGPMVVNVRPIPRHLLMKVIAISARYPLAHGGPVHIGDPSLIGIDLAKADWGHFTYPLDENMLPVFWACGVTPQAAAMECSTPEMITHHAGRMFVTDIRVEDAL